MKKRLLNHAIAMTKRFFYAMIIQCITLSMLFAAGGNAQNKTMREVMVKIGVENMNAVDFFKLVEKESGFNFVYTNKEIDKVKSISIEKRDQSLYNLLMEVAEQTQLSFKQINKNIHVQKYDLVKTRDIEQVKVMNYIPIRGKVISEDSPEGVPGINVLIKGSNTGTVTDLEGGFSLEVPNEQTVLIFSGIGFERQEVVVGNRSFINITMASKTSNLEEVVVVAYGTQIKKDITGSVASVNTNEIQDIPVIGIDQAIQGRVPGVQVTQNSGAPGSGVQVRVRGFTSINSNNEPLYVIDGVPINNTQVSNPRAGNDRVNGMAGVNPSDIASIEILKDAAATAIYGSRAANGVVLITTKRGNTGGSSVNFNSYFGFQEVAKRYELLNAQDYAELINEGEATRNRPAPFPTPPSTNTDWQDQIFRTAAITDNNLSISGGNERTQFLMSLGYMNQEGIVIGSDFQRTSLRLNLDHEVSSKLKVGTSISLSQSNLSRVKNDGSTFDSGFGPNVIGTALVFNPTIPVRNDNGTYAQTPVGFQNENPVAWALEPDLDTRSYRLIGNTYAEYKLLDNLTFRTTLGIDVRSEKDDFFLPPNTTLRGGARQGEASVNQFLEYLWLNENTLSYDFKLSSTQKLNFLLGFSQQESIQETSFSSSTGFSNGLLRNVSSGSANFGAGSNGSSWGILSYFGRVNYDYASKYLFSATFRVDGSSRFGTNNRYGFFPAFSAGWRLSDEGFMRDISSINDFKLRGSWGITGNQEIGNFDSRGTVVSGANYLGQPGVNISRLTSANLSWESTSQYNIGVDLTMFDGRINFVADYYYKLTEDLLFNANIPNTTGFGRSRQNVGSIENKGFEFGLLTYNIDGDFSWSTNFNISFNQNKILELADGQDILDGVRGRSNIAREGLPLSFYLFNQLGINPENGRVIWETDENGNRVEVLMGSPIPKHIGGMTNNFSYKNLELSVFLQWVYGNDIYNHTRSFMEDLGGPANGTIDVLNRWRQPGDITNIPKADYGGPDRSNNSGVNSSRYLEDGSFLRLKNVSLAYNFPSKIIERANIRSLRVYAMAQNLLTFTNYKGYDPEVSAYTDPVRGNLVVGVDQGTFPVARTITFGFNVGF